MCDAEQRIKTERFVEQDFRETLQETLECDAGINFSPYVDPFDQNIYGVAIYENGNDPEYVGRVFAKTVWEYWDGVRPYYDLFFPLPMQLLDVLMDEYLPFAFDRTNSPVDSFVEVVYDTASNIIERKYRGIMVDFYNETYKEAK